MNVHLVLDAIAMTRGAIVFEGDAPTRDAFENEDVLRDRFGDAFADDPLGVPYVVILVDGHANIFVVQSFEQLCTNLEMFSQGIARVVRMPRAVWNEIRTTLNSGRPCDPTITELDDVPSEMATAE